VKGTGPDGAIKEDVDHVIAKNRKIEPEKISAPAVAIRSAIAAAMSKSNRSTIIWKKDRLDKSIGLVTGNQ
jgi:pyruvate dehydrogenase E2 component (dihydrolipoamide acetyltransferase)